MALSKTILPKLSFPIREYLMGVVLCFVYVFTASFLINILLLILLSILGISGVLALPLANASRGVFNFTLGSLPGGYLCGWFIGKRVGEERSKKALTTSLTAAIIYALFYIVSFGNITLYFLLNYLLPICGGLILGSFIGAKEIDWKTPPSQPPQKPNQKGGPVGA